MPAAVTVIIISIIFALILSEGLLRILGYEPWTYHDLANEPTMHASHPVLGWQNKKGDYTIPPYHPSGKQIHITFDENGKRRTGDGRANHDGEMVIVGGSYTQGWAISDNETYPWKLQEKHPSLKVVNYGTGGYGTYQSLLVLEKELPRMATPRLVLYGFIDHHEVRNVAAGFWLRALSRASQRGHVNVPFATLGDNNETVRHPPMGYPLSLPFRESLATIALLERAYMKLTTRNRFSQRRSVTQSLISEMNTASEKFGATLLVVLLRSDDDIKNHYIHFLEQNDIRYVDCVYPLTNEMKVPGEGHPNGKMNTLWTECIVDSLQQDGTGHRF
jgi:hypothetical protein